nr:rho guanine nucleotide exchange factor 37-like isoform X1 [Procambarus clarkii]
MEPSVNNLQWDLSKTGDVTASLSDFDDDDFWDDEESFEVSGEARALTSEELAQPLHRVEHLPCYDLRVAELVTTEREYITDLETLLQVVSRFSSSKHIDLDTLLGNIHQVLDVARNLLKVLEGDQESCDDDVPVGSAFLQFATELSQVYKIYCSGYSVEVLPLLKKYEESEEAKEELARLAQELQCRRPHLLTLDTVLIKPVQRILKYRLYVSKLLDNTASTDPDYHDLQKASACLQAAARDVNEYTRGLDLVYKYREDVDHSLSGKMRRVTLHSIAKKSARMSTILSQKLGIISQTTSTGFDEEEAKFRSVEQAARSLVDHATTLLEAVRARHTAELIVSEGLAEILPNAPSVQAIKEATLDSCNRVLQMFDREVQERVLQPAVQVGTLCAAPARLIQKRYHKKLDYDAAQAKLQMAKDTNVATVAEEEEEEEDTHETGDYESLNTLLLEELPILTHWATEMLTFAIRSLAASRLYLQGHLAKLYLLLAQEPLLEYIDPIEARERAEHLVEQLRLLLPSDYHKKHSWDHHYSRTNDANTRKNEKAKMELSSHVLLSKTRLQAKKSAPESSSSTLLKPSRVCKSDPTRAMDTLRKKGKDRKRLSLPVEYLKGVATTLQSPQHPVTSTLPTCTPEVKRKDVVLGSYPRNSLYVAQRAHVKTRDNEVALTAGQVVAVLKKADPSGDASCWVINDGENVGLVSASCLRELEGHNKWNGRTTTATCQNNTLACTTPELHLQSTLPVPQSEGIDLQSASQALNLPVNQSKVSEPLTTGYQSLDTNSSSNNLCNAKEEQVSGSYPCSDPQVFVALYDFVGTDETQLNMHRGQLIWPISIKFPDWWYVHDDSGHEGYVPAAFLQKSDGGLEKTSKMQNSNIQNVTTIL